MIRAVHQLGRQIENRKINNQTVRMGGDTGNKQRVELKRMRERPAVCSYSIVLIFLAVAFSSLFLTVVASLSLFVDFLFSSRPLAKGAPSQQIFVAFSQAVGIRMPNSGCRHAFMDQAVGALFAHTSLTKTSTSHFGRFLVEKIGFFFFTLAV